MQNTKLIKKISTSLVSTGEIIDSLQSNSSTNAPSIRAVVDNMTPPMNLLINGDFKINQRGVSSYEINNSTWIYSIDLWRINGMKLQVNSDETITLTALNKTNYFQQIIENANYQTGDALILSAYIDGNIKTFNIHIGTTDYIDEKISIFASYNQEQKKIYLSLSLNQQSNYITLKWIRLDKGSIAYPHVAEDDAIALMRCREYVHVIEARSPVGTGMLKDEKTFYVELKTNLKNLPTITFKGGTIILQEGYQTSINNLSILSSYSSNGDLILVATSSSGFYSNIVSGICVAVDYPIILSCEPL